MRNIAVYMIEHFINFMLYFMVITNMVKTNEPGYIYKFLLPTTKTNMRNVLPMCQDWNHLLSHWMLLDFLTQYITAIQNQNHVSRKAFSGKN